MTDRRVIGYSADDKPIYEPPHGSIVTHAFIMCSVCHKPIYHCMGPQYGAQCLECYDALAKL